MMYEFLFNVLYHLLSSLLIMAITATSSIPGLSQRVESPRAQICVRAVFARPDVGASNTGAWVVRVFG